MLDTAKKISDIIEQLQNTSSTNDKKEILKEYINDNEFHEFLTYVYDEVNYIYGKSKLPAMPDTGTYEIYDSKLSEFYALINDMSSGVLKGNAADEAMIDYCVGKPLYYQDLLFYVIKRNIKAGINVKGINEVFGHIIPVAPYMRCESESYMSKRIVYKPNGALAQSKADGAFTNCEINEAYEDVVMTTRSGKQFLSSVFLNSLSNIAELHDVGHIVIHGELLVKNIDGTIMDRSKGNGKLNKYFKRASTLNELQDKYDSCKTTKCKEKIEKKMNSSIEEWEYISRNMVYEVWDVLYYEDWQNLESDETTIERFEKIKKYVESYNNYVKRSITDIYNCELRLIDHKIVHSSEEAMEFYQDQLDHGLEGMVIKNLNATWENDVNRQGIIKLKDFKECDLKIVGYELADNDSTFKGGIGSLIMESSDGNVKVNVSGMKRHERGLERIDENDSSKGLRVIDGFNFDKDIGKIAAVKFNELITRKDVEGYSLFLPSILEIRDDKTVADDLSKIKKDNKIKG